MHHLKDFWICDVPFVPTPCRLGVTSKTSKIVTSRRYEVGLYIKIILGQASMISILLGGIDMSENAQAMGAFKEVGPGKHFLGSEHRLKCGQVLT